MHLLPISETNRFVVETERMSVLLLLLLLLLLFGDTLRLKLLGAAFPNRVSVEPP